MAGGGFSYHAKVTNLNTYLVSGGDTTKVSGTPTVQALFAAAQAAATVSSSKLAPTLPVTAAFESTVSTNLATTVASGLGTAPTTFTIPANRLTFGLTSGTQTTSGVSTPFSGAALTWFDGSGAGKRFVSPGVGLRTISATNIASNAGSFTQSLTYSVKGNVVSRNVTLTNALGTTNIGSITDTITIQYSDSSSSFFAGNSTRTITAGPTVTNNAYSGSSVTLTPLTPLTPAMFAGKTITLSAPGCPLRFTTNVFSADGSSMQNLNCGPQGGTGEVRTFIASSIPGVIQSTSTGGVAPDGSIVMVGLDGPSLTAGSSLVLITINQGQNADGSSSFPASGRMNILSVK
jgi:hypothetical protein